MHLFAGAGGGILADLLLGHQPVCAVEINEYCQQVLSARQKDGCLPWFPIFADVTQFDGKPWRGIVDVISGGFPCQDISVAGKGAGIEGERSGLWKEFKRIIGEVEPSLVFVENSPMLTLRGLGTVLGDLASLGFDAEWGVLGGGAVGNICEGERIWILAFAPDSSMLEGLVFPQYLQSGSEESRRRQHSRAVGAMLSQDDYTSLKRDTDAVAAGMDRLKAIGNGQVPRVAATAFTLLSERAKG